MDVLLIKTGYLLLATLRYTDTITNNNFCILVYVILTHGLYFFNPFFFQLIYFIKVHEKSAVGPAHMGSY